MPDRIGRVRLAEIKAIKVELGLIKKGVEDGVFVTRNAKQGAVPRAKGGISYEGPESMGFYGVARRATPCILPTIQRESS